MSTDTEPRSATPRSAAPAGAGGDVRPRRRWRTPGQAVAILLGALLLGGVMNASSLADTAERQPFGWQRSVAVALVSPAEALAEATGLGGVHAWLVEGLGGWFRPTAREPAGPSPAAAGPPGDRAEASTAEGGEDDTAGGDASGEATPEGSEDDGDEPRRTPTEEEPLAVWVAGDSLVEPLGAALSAALEEDVPAEVAAEPQYSTGLARPDYFDWPAHARATVAEEEPDVVVVMLGGNDDQDMRGEDVIHRRDDVWVEEYRARVDDFLDALTAHGAEVLWVGLPVMQDPAFDAAMRELDEVYAAAADAHPRATHLPTRDLLAEDGGYTTYLEGADGGVERMRRDDGIHLTPDGGRLVAEALLAEVIAERWAPEADTADDAADGDA
ncbi:MAG: DUF459 domain-containing protein [Egibacteraceae bacterium]